MSELPTLLSNWLYNVVNPQYIEKQLTYTHLYQFLQVHYGKNFKFRIRTSVYISLKTGHLELLLNIFGSIPTNTFSVPVQIWIPLAYPFGRGANDSEDNNGVPMVYILPDSARGIQIKPGNHVDNLGRFYHPYLSNWFHECKQNSPNFRKFTILELLKVLQQSFNKSCPIAIPVEHLPLSPGQQPPIVPSKIPLNQISPQITGPPLPIKPNTSPGNPVPLKYQSPLPLPGTQSIQSLERPITAPNADYHQQQHFNGGDVNSFQSIYNNVNQFSYSVTTRSPIAQSPQPTGQSNSSMLPPLQSQQPYQQQHVQPIHPPPTHSNTQPQMSSNLPGQNQPKHGAYIDLIDEDTRTNALDHNSKNPEVTSKVQNLILNTLAAENNNIQLANSNNEKIETLFNQLNHHHKQAVANSSNLESHLSYLAQQMSAVTALNKELANMEENNLENNEEVYANGSTSIPLDSIISPDLALVNQLYNIVSEIKATKDTIDLIGGNFKNEGELITDARLESSVRMVRTLARENFWLEVMKSEVSARMDL